MIQYCFPSSLSFPSCQFLQDGEDRTGYDGISFSLILFKFPQYLAYPAACDPAYPVLSFYLAYPVQHDLRMFLRLQF